MRVSRIEKIFILIAFIALWAGLAAYAGAPIYSDEFLYIDAGLRQFAEPSYGNRYFHIYLQKLFMEIAPTPLRGVRVFWGLLIALTAVQIYYHARTLTRHSGLLHGLLGLAFFFSFPFIVEYSGEPAVDITAMAMVTLFISFYLYALQDPLRRRAALAVLGTLVFILFKTKETTILIFFLFLGFGFDADGRWRWKSLVPLIKPLLIGFGGGILLFIVLDGLILGQPFFAISPATFAAIFKNYDFQPGFFVSPSSWYGEYFLDELLLPFLLFVISGVKVRGKVSRQRHLLWVYPLLMAAFVSLNMLKITFGFIERFYFPALPVIAMLAPQALRIKWPRQPLQWAGFGLLTAAAAGLLLALRGSLLNFSASMEFDFAALLESVYYPVLLSILLASLMWEKRFHWAASVVPLFCIAAMLFSPLVHTQKYFMRIPWVQNRYDHMMEPFIEFGEHLALQPNDFLLVSAALDSDLELLSDDPNDITGMYNFFFDRLISEEQVVIGYTSASTARLLDQRPVTHALLTAEQWRALPVHLKSGKFEALPSASGQYTLLIRQ